MSRLLCFLAGFVLASVAPVVAQQAVIHCEPRTLPPPPKCDPTALNYNRAPLECHTA